MEEKIKCPKCGRTEKTKNGRHVDFFDIILLDFLVKFTVGLILFHDFFFCFSLLFLLLILSTHYGNALFLVILYLFVYFFSLYNLFFHNSKLNLSDHQINSILYLVKFFEFYQPHSNFLRI